MTFTIEQNVEMPKQTRAPRKPKYPLADMEVGHSFLVQCEDDQQTKVGRRMGSNCATFSRAHPSIKFSWRRVYGGVRVWRVK